MSKIESEALG